MGWIHASAMQAPYTTGAFQIAIVANVVKRHTVGNWPDQYFVYRSMHRMGDLCNLDLAVSLLVTRPHPYPALAYFLKANAPPLWETRDH